MKKQLLLENDVVNGFSYSFAAALLGKLHELYAHSEVFGDSRGTLGDEPSFTLAQSSYGVVSYLCEQIRFKHFDIDCWTNTDVINLIDAARKFLAIFEKK